MVEAQEVELGVAGLLGLQHDLELRPLLAHEVGRPLDDGVHLGGGRLGQTHARYRLPPCHWPCDLQQKTTLAFLPIGRNERTFQLEGPSLQTGLSWL